MFSFRKEVTVKQKSGGGFVKGVWVEGSEASITILASIQPTSPTDMESLPEGRRNRKAFRLYTNVKLNDLSTENPDTAEIDGKDYEITAEMQWQNEVINHYKYIVTKEIEA